MASKHAPLTLAGLLTASLVTAGLAGLSPAAAKPSPAAGMAAASPTVAAASTAKAYWTSNRMRGARSLDTAVSAAQARTLAQAAATVARGTPGRSAPQAATAKAGTAQVGSAQAGSAQVARNTLKSGPGFGATAAGWYGAPTSPPATTSGRIFFTGNDGLGYSCSGSTVNSSGKNLVFTAGHCVHPGGTGTWFSNWVFVPRYTNGSAPYGTWSSRQLWSWTLWTQNGNRAYDIGVAVMNTLGGQHIVNIVGGQGLEWNYPLEQYVYQFGYPARSPFNGGTLQYCSGWTYNDGGNEGINCNMTEGASGGPWLARFGGTFGYLDSVNSWVFWDGNGVRYKWNGPYFGNDARDLYNTTANL
ncbi:MAG: peptidase [Frankiaceae bacterium]